MRTNLIVVCVLLAALVTPARAASPRPEWVVVIAHAGRSVTLRHRDGAIEAVTTSTLWPLSVVDLPGICVNSGEHRGGVKKRVVAWVADARCRSRQGIGGTDGVRS
jgi:hypothetical protein